MKVVNAPYLEELRSAFERVVDSARFVDGDEVAHFESLLSRQVGAPHAIAVDSGTSALQLALQAAGIGAGDEVLVPANSFFATAEAVIATGAEPKLVDCHPSTALIDLDAARAAIGPRTAAMVPVHLYGQPVDMDHARALARRYRLFLLEDAAQAIGALWNEKPVGSFGDAAAFSFYPGKNLGALGDAGAVTTSDTALAERVSRLRSHGGVRKYEHTEWGHNARMDTLQAAFLMVKLPGLSRAQGLRDAAVARYQHLTAGTRSIRWLQTHPAARHVWHLAVVQVPDRDEVIAQMSDEGILTAVHYPTPIHLTPAAQGRLGRLGDFPAAERLSRSIVSLPLFAGISDDQITRVSETLMEVVDGLQS